MKVMIVVLAGLIALTAALWARDAWARRQFRKYRSGGLGRASEMRQTFSDSVRKVEAEQDERRDLKGE